MPAESRMVRSIDPVLTELSEAMKNYEQVKENLLSKLKFSRLPLHEGLDLDNGITYAAVDSSSAIIVDAGCFMVMAYRSGSVVSKNGVVTDIHHGAGVPIELSLLNSSELAVEKNFQKILSPLVSAMTGSAEVPPELVPTLRQPHPRDIDWLQLVRSVLEWREVRLLLDSLSEGDYILRDGALRADIRIPPSMVEDILQLAGDRGIHVVGLVKRSSIPVGPGQLMPVVPAVQKLGAVELPGNNWYTPLPRDDGIDNYPYDYGRSFIVQYHPLSQYVFWTDINKYDHVTPHDAFTNIVSLCNDPVYIGYPYPLAYIHNNVIITRSDVEDIKYDLQSTALETKTLSPGGWELLFNNFHDILDVNLY